MSRSIRLSVPDALHALADFTDADALAAHLAEHGHVGNREDGGTRSPLAVHLAAVTGEQVIVGGRRWFAGPAWGYLPAVAHAFAEAFRAGNYPELDITRTDRKAA